MKRFYSYIIAIISCILCVIFFVVLSLVSSQDMRGIEVQPDFYLDCENISILPWEKNNTIYWFLPSYIHKDDVKIRIPDGELFLDGEMIKNKTSIDLFETGKVFSYCFKSKNEVKSGNMQFLQSANVGTVFIETESGTMEQIDSDKEYRESGLILVKNQDGITSYWGHMNSIKGRGNATWGTMKNLIQLVCLTLQICLGWGMQKSGF